MAAIARTTTGNRFEVLLEEETATELRTSASASASTPSASASASTSGQIKADHHEMVECFDSMTAGVVRDVKFKEMKVYLSDVFSNWPSDWLMQHKEDKLLQDCKKPHEKHENACKKARQDRRIAFIATCLYEIAMVCTTMQKALKSTRGTSEMMNFADSPLIITKEKMVPTENYCIYDEDFIKVYTVLQQRVWNYTKVYLDKYIKSLPKGEQAKVRKPIEKLFSDMKGIRQGLYSQLDTMNDMRAQDRMQRSDDKKAFFDNRSESIAQRALEKKADAIAVTERSLRGNWSQSSGPASKHSAHQEEIQRKKDKRAHEKAEKAKAEKASTKA